MSGPSEGCLGSALAPATNSSYSPRSVSNRLRLGICQTQKSVTSKAGQPTCENLSQNPLPGDLGGTQPVPRNQM